MHPPRTALFSLLLLGGPALAQDAPPNRVAVVVGLSNYENLPREVHLDFARSDAATVAKALREEARFEHVFLLRDSEATRDAIRETLRNRAAQVTGPDDVFVFYFAGHGIGADLGMPTLLAYDSTLENGQEDGFELLAFARDLQTWIRAGTTLIVTDAIHRNQLDGIYFYGPAADQWPPMPPGTMLLSSSARNQGARDGAFGPLFAQGLAGGADAGRTGNVQARELFDFLHGELASAGQTPVVAGQFSNEMVVFHQVSGAPVERVAPDEVVPQVVYPDVRITAAKFVWQDGEAQKVQCREEQPVRCAPSCYVRSFMAGPCVLTSGDGDEAVSGEVVILQPGRYFCAPHGQTVRCTGP